VSTEAILLDSLAIEYVTRHPGTAAQAMQDLDPEDAAMVVSAAPPRAAAELLASLGADSAVRIMKRLSPETSRRALADTDPGVATAMLRRLGGGEEQRALLVSLAPARRREVETYLSYPENSAASLMDPAAPVFREDARAGDVAAALRESRRLGDDVVMVVTPEGQLRGTIATVEVLLASDDTRLTSLRIKRTPTIEAFASRAEVAEILERQRLAALPVIDVTGRPVGALSQRALALVAEQDAAADMQTMVGASRDERALSSAAFAVRRRLPWLQINLLTAFLAAAVVGLFEGTIAQFTALAVLLPVVAGQSGNTGAQALAVTMRGLTLHEIGLRHWRSVAIKEATVGFVNGLAVAVPTMAGVYLWSGSAGLSAVIGLAMVLSMTMAGIAGACVPMALRASGQDPAQSSSIVLTTVTDVSGFLSFLGLGALFARLL
jgi:magnesium transporter